MLKCSLGTTCIWLEEVYNSVGNGKKNRNNKLGMDLCLYTIEWSNEREEMKFYECVLEFERRRMSVDWGISVGELEVAIYLEWQGSGLQAGSEVHNA